MKRLFLLAAVLLFSSPVWAAYSHVACSGTCTSNGVTTSLLLPSSGTLTFGAGHLLVVAIHGADTGATTLSLAGTTGPAITFTCLSAQNSKTPSGSQIVICYANNIASGSYALTVSATNSTNIHARVDEYNGSPASCANPLEAGQTIATTSSSSTGPPATGSLTAAGADLLYAAGSSGANETWTATTNGMMGSTGSIRTVTNSRVAAEDRILGAGASGTAQISWSGATADGVISYVIFGITCPVAGGAATMPPVVY